MNSIRKAVFCLALCLLSAPAWADTVSLPLTDDAWINANSPSGNFGTVESIFVHNWGPKYGLVRFDAASIAGQTVNSATLELYLSSIGASGDISVHAITSSWDETTVMWNNQPSTESVATAIVSLTTGDAGGTVVIDVTGAAQRWADGGLVDAGFLIVTSDSIKAYFDAKERAGGVPASLTVETAGGSVPPPYDGKAIVLDFTDPDNCTIDKPGYYILDRNWDFTKLNHNGACHDTGPLGRGGVYIVADGVIVNFRGFAIELQRPDGSNKGDATVHIGTFNVTLLNGTIAGNSAVFGEANSIVTMQSMTLLGDSSIATGTILNSRVYSTYDRGGIDFDGCPDDQQCPAIVVRQNSFTCTVPSSFCLDIARHHFSEIRDNTFTGKNGIRLYGGAAVVSDNLIRISMTDSQDAGIWAYLTSKIIARNIVLNDTGIGKGLTLTGHQGIVEGNIVSGTSTGILFVSGANNYFGNNRVSAITPFFNHEAQIDWGGNVSY